MQYEVSRCINVVNYKINCNDQCVQPHLSIIIKIINLTAYRVWFPISENTLIPLRNTRATINQEGKSYVIIINMYFITRVVPRQSNVITV